MKKKAKPKAKAKLKVLPPPVDIEREAAKRRPGDPIPAPPQVLEPERGQVELLTIKSCVKSYEQNTGAKANQTRLNDFVRWCEDNSGLF